MNEVDGKLRKNRKLGDKIERNARFSKKKTNFKFPAPKPQEFDVFPQNS